MDAISREKAERVADDWRLNADERAQLLDQPDQVSAVMSIHDSLHRIFENREQADSWIKKPNEAFDNRSISCLMVTLSRSASI